MDLETLVIPFDASQADGLVEEWRWLIGADRRPFLATAMGDVFLVCPSDGAVSLLEPGPATLTPIAGSMDDFKALCSSEEFVKARFVPDVVTSLRESGLTLAPGQVFGFRDPPILGGAYSPDNLEPTDLAVHLALLGQIAHQLSVVPTGAPVSGVTVS
ncbi:MAG: DUF1851 domain-containing protein [Cyanobacteria bacterium SZAS LIN-2]|nr:DUF1851 domain-containing protein [Cyanobacteria bacterium SZAS LIN-2]